METVINSLVGVTGSMISAYVFEGIFPPPTTAGDPPVSVIWLEFFGGILEFALYTVFAGAIAFYLNSLYPTTGPQAILSLAMGLFFLKNGLTKILRFYYSIPPFFNAFSNGETNK